MSSDSTKSSALNVRKPHTYSIKSLLHEIRSAPQLSSPTSTSISGEITSRTVRWPWPSSTDSSRGRSSSKSKADPTAPRRRRLPKTTPPDNCSPHNQPGCTRDRPLQPHSWPPLDCHNGPFFGRHRHPGSHNCAGPLDTDAFAHCPLRM